MNEDPFFVGLIHRREATSNKQQAYSLRSPSSPLTSSSLKSLKTLFSFFFFFPCLFIPRSFPQFFSQSFHFSSQVSINFQFWSSISIPIICFYIILACFHNWQWKMVSLFTSGASIFGFPFSSWGWFFVEFCDF